VLMEGHVDVLGGLAVTTLGKERSILRSTQFGVYATCCISRSLTYRVIGGSLNFSPCSVMAASRSPLVHSSPRHACALHRVLFLHYLQQGSAQALYAVLRDFQASAGPAVPRAKGGDSAALRGRCVSRAARSGDGGCPENGNFCDPASYGFVSS
jgi:hypothetical protein